MGQSCSKPDGYDEGEDLGMKSQLQETDNLARASTLTFNNEQKNFWLVETDNLKTSNPMFGSRRKTQLPKPLTGDRSVSPIGYRADRKVNTSVQAGSSIFGRSPMKASKNYDQSFYGDEDSSMGHSRMVKPQNHTLNTLKMANASHQVNEDMNSPRQSHNSSFQTPHGFRTRQAKRVSFYQPSEAGSFLRTPRDSEQSIHSIHVGMKQSQNSVLSKFPQEGERFDDKNPFRKKIGDKYDPQIKEKAQRRSQLHSMKNSHNLTLNTIPASNSIYIQNPRASQQNHRTWDERHKIGNLLPPRSGKTSQYSAIPDRRGMKSSQYSNISGVSAYSNKPGWRVYETFKPEYRSGYHGDASHSNTPEKRYKKYSKEIKRRKGGRDPRFMSRKDLEEYLRIRTILKEKKLREKREREKRTKPYVRIFLKFIN